MPTKPIPGHTAAAAAAHAAGGGEVACDPRPANAAPLVPAAVLDALSARMRQGGLCLGVLNPDGTLACADPTPGGFFAKFAMPLLALRQATPPAGPPSAVMAAAPLDPASPIVLWRQVPGTLVAAFPLADRRHVQAVVVLAGKSADFRLSEDVLRACGRIGLDGIWLSQQADELPGYTDEALQRQARLLLAMLRDQVRLGDLEGELETLSNQLANTYEELSLIYQLTSGMKVNRSAGDFFRQTCVNVMQVLGVRAMGVALRGDGAVCQPPTLYGPMALAQPVVDRLAENLLAVFARRPGALLVNQVGKDKTFHWLGDHAHQLLAVPLVRQEQVLGCLFALDKEADEFNSVDTKLLTSISNESAVYLENAMLYEDVHGLMMGLLHSLTSAVDAKDTYTCGHSERVALLSRHLAIESGMSEAAAARVYMAGLLHDVGKIGVPESVLQKSGRLTPEEFEQIKKHPEIGARILRDVKQVGDLIPGVLHHHERYDGKGYPAGLSGEEIPLMGRVICLADCFDAMTSSRTYRKALPLEVAMAEIRRCAGTQFDPRLADAFLQVAPDELREMLKNHAAVTRRMLQTAPPAAVPPQRAA